MSKKFIGIFVTTASIFIVLFAFTNCKPIHESDGSIEILSLSECEQSFNTFYEDTIQQFYDVHSGFTCGSCHSYGGDDGPQFFDSFSIFASIGKSKSSVQDKVKYATNKILRNAVDGWDSNGWDHEAGALTSVDYLSEDSVRADLAAADLAYEECKASDAEGPEDL